MKKHSVIFISFMFLYIAVIAGCGLKGNPVPYTVKTENIQVITNLEIISAETTITLKWNFQDNGRVIKYIGIERSEAGSPGNQCKDCPRTFEKIGQVSLEEPRQADKVQSAYNYDDKNVTRGKIYSYRLMLCENNGNCSEGAIKEINYK